MSYTGFENLTDAELISLMELHGDSVSRELLNRLVDLHLLLDQKLDETYTFSEASDMIQGLRRQVDVLNEEREDLHSRIEHLEEVVEELEDQLSDLQLELKEAST
jgi:uncharacterized coiled-coil DUF342 family protein